MKVIERNIKWIFDRRGNFPKSILHFLSVTFIMQVKILPIKEANLNKFPRSKNPEVRIFIFSLQY